MEEPDQKRTELRLLNNKYEINKILLILIVFGLFFHRSGSGFSGSDPPDFSDDPDTYPDSGKKFDPDLEKKSGSKTLVHYKLGYSF